jgi:hypothetical protein
VNESAKNNVVQYCLINSDDVVTGICIIKCHLVVDVTGNSITMKYQIESKLHITFQTPGRCPNGVAHMACR